MDKITHYIYLVNLHMCKQCVNTNLFTNMSTQTVTFTHSNNQTSPKHTTHTGANINKYTHLLCNHSLKYKLRHPQTFLTDPLHRHTHSHFGHSSIQQTFVEFLLCDGHK